MKKVLLCGMGLLLTLTWFTPALAAETGPSVMLNGRILTFTEEPYRENGAVMVPAAEMAAYLGLAAPSADKTFLPVREQAEKAEVRVDWCESAQTVVLTDVRGLAEMVCAQIPGLTELQAWKPEIPIWLDVEAAFQWSQTVQSLEPDEKDTQMDVKGKAWGQLYPNGVSVGADVVTTGIDDDNLSFLMRLMGMNNVSVGGVLVNDTIYMKWPFLNKTVSFLIAEQDAKLAGTLMENFKNGWVSMKWPSLSSPPEAELDSGFYPPKNVDEVMDLWETHAPELYEEMWQSILPVGSIEQVEEELNWALDDLMWKSYTTLDYEFDKETNDVIRKTPDDSYLLDSYQALLTEARTYQNIGITRTEENGRVSFAITRDDTGPEEGYTTGTKTAIRLEAVDGVLTQVSAQEWRNDLYYSSVDTTQTTASITLTPAKPDAKVTAPKGQITDLTKLLEEWQALSSVNNLPYWLLP